MGMYGIGTDIVNINRFVEWESKPLIHLQKIFNDKEIHEALSLPSALAPQFFASRFAAKEAFYKALCSLLVSLDYQSSFPRFDQVRTLCSISKHSSGVPLLQIEWNNIEKIMVYPLPLINAQCSLSHEKEYALATVLLITKK